MNFVNSSSKYNDQLQISYAIRIAESTFTNKLETGNGKNLLGKIQYQWGTRWGSHLRSFYSLVDLFDPVLFCFKWDMIVNDKSSIYVIDEAYDIMM